MQVRLDIADTVIQHNQEKAKTSLENAKKDGHMCSKLKNTRRNVTVCFRQYALLNASRGLCKYRLNSGFLLNSKVFSPD
jgi:hypothetical protein